MRCDSLAIGRFPLSLTRKTTPSEPTYTDATGQTQTRTESEFSGLTGTVYTHRGCHCLEMPFTSEAFEINSDDCKCSLPFFAARSLAEKSCRTDAGSGIPAVMQGTRLAYGAYRQTTALRFSGLFIPRGALITSARLIFVAQDDDQTSQEVTLRISAPLMPHAPTFDCNAVASREGVAPCRNADKTWVTARMGDEGNMWTGSNATASRPRGR